MRFLVHYFECHWKIFSSCKQLENAESFISKEREESYRCHTEKCIIVSDLSQDQVSYMTREYQDASQRARRLSASREKMLTGRGNPVSLLTQDDVVIYLQWLVCHLHSVQPIHHFLRVKSHRQMLSLFILSDACGALFHIKVCFNRCCTIYLCVKEKMKHQERIVGKLRMKDNRLMVSFSLHTCFL